ncbi:hypothetical protein [Acetonema longum]|uniref:Uncharacterized protein n=1 Tax=Acetonema longum DSM 6540 TaxID=1009370 RepID=F7NG79_9FIRM|nr:hypothetical protein [Acetonema longum]EGO64997.1 hypothetical protein ALO_05328 [Acetonema longum DSM 6540]
MNNIVKKTIVYSLIGIMQLGWGMTALEAASRQDRCEKKYEKRHVTRAQRVREENERHRREMQRRHHESARDWRERQKREKDHHEEVMRTIGGLALLAIILNNADGN